MRATEGIAAVAKQSSYQSKIPDVNGNFTYSDEDCAVWHDLLVRQEKLLPGRVCEEFLEGLDALELPRDRVPQLREINERLNQASGFGVAPVPALISPHRFFSLLAEKKFPVATFIRRREDLDYLQEPDIFHEIFGHCPLLTHPEYAAFLEAYGRAALSAGKPYYWSFQRLFWFTVEFGLIEKPEGPRIYGAGIASSPGETVFALESDAPERRPLDLVTVFRTPYRIDIYQMVYYVIRDFGDLLGLVSQDLRPLIDEAKRLGPLAPTFPPKPGASAA